MSMDASDLRAAATEWGAAVGWLRSVSWVARGTEWMNMGKVWTTLKRMLLDAFDGQGLSGNAKRLHGPAEFPGLRIREKDWPAQLSSLAVGPGAYVQCFNSRDFHDSIFWLLPNSG